MIRVQESSGRSYRAVIRHIPEFGIATLMPNAA
jgi:hypothetical protein